MHIDCVATQTLTALASEASALEAAGCDGLWIGEVRHDPFLQAVLAAAATTTAQVGTGVAVALARSPMTLAYSGWDLQQHAQGRFILGLGSQVKAHVERRFSMTWSKPVAQMRELVQATREIWEVWRSGGKLSFTGEHYSHTLMAPMFVPESAEFPPPPIYLAAVGDRMARLVGEVADGFIAHPFTTPRYLREVVIPMIAEGQRLAGRSGDQVTICAKTFVATGADDQGVALAADVVRGQIAFYASTPAYRPVLELHGWAGIQPELTELSKAGRWAELAQRVPDEMLHEFAVVGHAADVAREIDARFGSWAHRLVLLGESVAPNLGQIIAGDPARRQVAKPNSDS